MRKDLGRELCEQPGKVVVLFAISPCRQFEHPLAAGSQLVCIVPGRHLTLPIRHLVHLSNKLIFPRQVPDIRRSSFAELRRKFLPFPRTRRLCRTTSVKIIRSTAEPNEHQMSKWCIGLT